MVLLHVWIFDDGVLVGTGYLVVSDAFLAWLFGFACILFAMCLFDLDIRKLAWAGVLNFLHDFSLRMHACWLGCSGPT